MVEAANMSVIEASNAIATLKLWPGKVCCCDSKGVRPLDL